ncbi:SCO3374 family protein [Streptomyces sp. NBC_00102]|uniref:SCO3374 family protein n=1 Tax=Streptomyces sp. NBC_00102 TaxID=2975652 RepID=UPI00224F8C11|nr:SCO3374 family protein [Streptomyces sp. NBC_00102]MCX5398774.1 SCO3374 family protein [Streptomyces sp. NBC_00102]
MTPIVPSPRAPRPSDTSAPAPSGRGPAPDAGTRPAAGRASGTESAGPLPYGDAEGPADSEEAAAATERWYEDGLGWATDGGRPPALLTGVRFDVLELPAAAGRAVLRRFGRTGPVAVARGRMRLFVAAGSAEELPALLDWLEWGGIALDLVGIGAGGRITAPAPPRLSHRFPPGAAFWLRPPEPPRGPDPFLPGLADFGSRGGDAPDLVRLVDMAATECHRVRLRRSRVLPPAVGPSSQPLARS